MCDTQKTTNKVRNDSLQVRDNGLHHPVLALVDGPESVEAVRKHYGNIRSVFVVPMDLERAGVENRKIYGELYHDGLGKPDNLCKVSLGRHISVDLEMKTIPLGDVPRHLLVTANLDTLSDHTGIGVYNLILANEAKVGARSVFRSFPTPDGGFYEVLHGLIAIDVYPKGETSKWDDKMIEPPSNEVFHHQPDLVESVTETTREEMRTLITNTRNEETDLPADPHKTQN